MKTISRALFILKVVQHYEANKWREHWRVEDSFVCVAEYIDLADMPEVDFDMLIVDCKKNAMKYLKCCE